MNFKEINYKNIKITPEFARLHAHICADGYIYSGKSKRSQNELIAHPRRNLIRNRFYVRYVNMEETLKNQFEEDIMSVFGRKSQWLKKLEIGVCGKWIYEIFFNLGALKSHSWFIPKKIRKSRRKVRAEWLKAFFDDESYVSKKQKRIVLNMVNKNGLDQVQLMLGDFGIKSRLKGPYNYKKYSSYHLTIYKESLLNYWKFIGFNHPKKKKESDGILNGDAGTFVRRA